MKRIHRLVCIAHELLKLREEKVEQRNRTRRRALEIKRVHRLVGLVFQLLSLRAEKVQQRYLLEEKAFHSWKFIVGMSWAWSHGLVVVHWIPGVYKLLTRTKEKFQELFPKNEKISKKTQDEMELFRTFGRAPGTVVNVAIRALNGDMWEIVSKIGTKNVKTKIAYARYANIWDTLIYELSTLFIIFTKCFKLLIGTNKEILGYWNLLSMMCPDRLIQNWIQTMELVALRNPKLNFRNVDSAKIGKRLTEIIEKSRLDQKILPCTECAKEFFIKEFVSEKDLHSRCRKCRVDAETPDFDILVLIERIFKLTIRID
jgi:hypothetical protein